MTRRFWGICLVSIALTASLGLVFAREQAGGAAGARAAAEKAWRAGQYEDVESPRAGRRTPTSCSPSSAPGAPRPRRLRARRIDPPAVCREDAGGDAALELGLLQSQLGTPHRGAPHAAADPAGRPRDADARATTCARRARRARSAASTMPRRSSAMRSRWRRPTSRVNTEWGELFLEKYNNAEAAKSFQEALKVDPELRPGAARHGARARRRESAAGDGVRAARAEAEPERRRRAARSWPSSRSTRTRKPDAQGAIDKALEVNPNSLEALSMKAALAYVEGDTAEYQAAGRRGAEDQSDLRRDSSHRRLDHRALLPLRRSGRAHAQGDRARSRELPRRAPISARS